jgi:hypothetical protein
VPPPADFDDETLVLQCPEVMAKLLTRNADPRGENSGGGRLAGEFGEQPGAPGVQSRGGRSRFVEDLDIEHRVIVSLTGNPVKARTPKRSSSGPVVGPR